MANTHSDSGSIRRQRSFKSVRVNAEFDGIRFRCHVEAAVAEFVEIPKGTLVLGHELAHEVIDRMFDRHHSRTEVSG